MDPEDCEWVPFDDFDGSCDVRIGFRTTKQADPAEHWMNRLSVSWTRRRGDIEPGGSICHAEIMLQVRPGEWRRWSIAKKTFTRGADGVKRWIPGRVHCKPVDVMNDDYVYIKIFMNRKSQTNMYEFLMSQVGGGFNMTGYTLNFMVPCGGFGTRRYFPGIEQRRRKWFCTELITCALQAGALQPLRCYKPLYMSPNKLYRVCSKLSSAMPVMNPVRRAHIVL